MTHAVDILDTSAVNITLVLTLCEHYLDVTLTLLTLVEHCYNIDFVCY